MTAAHANRFGDAIDAKYDAWGRVVRVQLRHGVASLPEVVTYEFDALGRLFSKIENITIASVNSIHDRVFIYDLAGLVLEERTLALDVAVQHVWSAAAPGKMVLR